MLGVLYFQVNIMLSSQTLTQFLLHHLAKHPDQMTLSLLLSDLATIGKAISQKTNKAGIAKILGSAGKTNVQDEEVQKLDMLSNELCKEYLTQTGRVAALASEEEDMPVDMGNAGKDAAYVIAFDPLDGSSNIDVNVSIGTIFSVHKRLPGIERTNERQFLQKGNEQVLAGYILYGSSTVLVCSFGDGVHEFTLDQGLGEFLLSQEHISIPSNAKYYSVNECNMKYVRENDQKRMLWLRDESGLRGRYIGSLVADFHRNLIKGGVFMYPEIDGKNTGTYAGKLRLNYELKPMAFLIEQAGGVATNGKGDNILDMTPDSLHQRCGFLVGNATVVEHIKKIT